MEIFVKLGKYDLEILLQIHTAVTLNESVQSHQNGRNNKPLNHKTDHTRNNLRNKKIKQFHLFVKFSQLR